MQIILWKSQSIIWIANKQRAKSPCNLRNAIHVILMWNHYLHIQNLHSLPSLHQGKWQENNINSKNSIIYLSPINTIWLAKVVINTHLSRQENYMYELEIHKSACEQRISNTINSCWPVWYCNIEIFGIYYLFPTHRGLSRAVIECPSLYY